MSELSHIEMSVSPVQKFREYLTTKGMRLTTEREAIVEAIFSHHEHFDREQMVERLTAQDTGGKRVSRATIFRTIASLEEAGLIRKVARANDRAVYEHAYGYPQHDHMICERCGSLTEFVSEEINAALEEVTLKHGFRMKAHRLEVYGICDECSKPKKRPYGKLNMV
ncbi:MAG: Fur family transcriptional regulator [Planctomycetaceae bacterium]